MQVSVEAGDGLVRQIKVDLPAESIEQEVDKRLRDFARSARLPGFRPGKVPLKLLRQRYGASVRGEVFGEQVQSSFPKAVAEAELRPVGMPDIEPDIDQAQGRYSYVAKFEVLPDIELASLSGQSIARPVAEVTEADVDYDVAREQNRPIHADRVWIDSLLEEMFDEDEQEMLDLVEIRAPEEIEMTLEDLVLTDDQENEIHKVVKAIEHRDYLAEIGLREIGKLLFVGPPGTGKTSVARALAHDLDLPFVEVKLSMITSQYLGETAKNVDKTFEIAKRLSPCILFMDEFDFVAKTRSSDEHAAIKRAVNTLLKSIDEISLIQDDVLLIGATNHPDQLDAAAWRRFDEIVNFPKPDSGMRADILQIVTRRMEIDDFDPAALAEATEGLTGSDLRLVLREAVLDALTEERTTLTQSDLLDAIEGFEERDNLKNMDMIEGDADALVAGGSDGHDHDH